MTYSKEVTNKIVECWGLGFTAEETVTVIDEWKGIHIGLATIYRHRHSLTAQQIIEELMRKQMRDIATADQPLRMKYRDKLLDKLVPQRIEATSISEIKETVTFNVTENEDSILNEAAHILNQRLQSKKESAGIH